MVIMEASYASKIQSSRLDWKHFLSFPWISGPFILDML